MSELRVDNIVDMGGSGAPQLRKGASVTGISTITQAVVGNATINAGGINATGIVTSSSNKFVGDFASGNITAGVMTATSSVVASNITINSGGVNASGIVSATSYQGSGANLTGIGLSIAPLAYNPDPSAVDASLSTGIGLTFNQRVSAGVGTVTLSLVSIGSTVAEVFGLGNATSTTYTVTVASSKFYLDGNLQYSPTLYPGNTYTFDQSNATNATHILRFATAADAAGSTEYTTGVETNGTPGNSGAYTRITVATDAPDTLYYYCTAHSNMGSSVSIGANVQYNNDADPPNITITPKNNLIKNTVYAINYPPGAFTQSGAGGSFVGAGYTFDSVDINNQLWTVGYNDKGQRGQSNLTDYSSPVQVGSDSNWEKGPVSHTGAKMNMVTKTDGTLWVWGYNSNNMLAVGNQTEYSSPVQIPGTTWQQGYIGTYSAAALRTNGTLWAWGANNFGTLGMNQAEPASPNSPVQMGTLTNWTSKGFRAMHCGHINTSGELYMWGLYMHGEVGNNTNSGGEYKGYSSPVQIPGTNWSDVRGSSYNTIATRTDGTLWTWGRNNVGQLGLGNKTSYSSPKQIPGTNWATGDNKIASGYNMAAIRTDGTLWVWGQNNVGQLGQNNTTEYSSPRQVPGTNWSTVGGGNQPFIATKTDGTMWTWGNNDKGGLGLNQSSPVKLSSPTQIPGTTWSTAGSMSYGSWAITS